MAKRKLNSHALRRLAEEFLETLDVEEDISEFDREDLTTSLVRQWVTYEGHAALFIGQRLFQLLLGSTPLGKPCVVPSQITPAWSILLREKNVRLDELPEIFAQFNRGQSAEVENADGVPVRLWVDPKSQKISIEELVKTPVSPDARRDKHRIARLHLEYDFGNNADDDELDKLAASVVSQWQRFEGHARLFMVGNRQVSYTLKESDKNFDVIVTYHHDDMQASLGSLGCPPEVIPQLLAHLSLGRNIALRGPTVGLERVVIFNAKTGQLNVREGSPKQLSPPVNCPHCNAILAIWGPATRQSCSACGGEVSRTYL